MFQEFGDSLQYVQKHEIKLIDLKYCDLWGSWRHLTIPATQFTARLLETGIGLDGSSVGLKNVKAGDMIMVPDISSGFVDPFWEVPLLSFLCTIQSGDVHEVFSNDPRGIALRAESYLQSTGIGTHSRWGPEFEFFVFDKAVYKNIMGQAGYSFISGAAEWSRRENGVGPYLAQHGGYHACPPKDRYFNLRNNLALTLDSMGVPVKYHHHEVGSAGQLEVETPMMGIISAGDAVLLVKYAAKMTAAQYQKSVTFMPKPIYGEAGNGMHFHQNLFDSKRNVFYDPDTYGCLSQTAKYYIGGLLHHGPAVLGLTNPSTNSYRRLVPGYEAPVNAFYSLGNRSAAIRIPKYACRSDTARIEFRPPDATCNPYLALAAQLMAGIDGIKRQLDPADLGYGPIDEDIFSWTDNKRREIKPLPTSLEEALQALEEDHEFLLEGDVFNENLIQAWVEHKREAECYPVRSRPHPYEMSLYYDV